MNSKEKWISDTMASIEGIRRAEWDTLAFEKVTERFRNPDRKIFVLTPRQLWQVAAGLALLISLNVLSLVYYPRSTDTSQNNVKTLASEYFSYLDSVKF